MRPWRYKVTITPCALRTCLQWLTVSLMGKVSPGSTPARITSVFAMMVLSGTDGVVLRVSLRPVLGSLTTWKLWLLLLGRLDELTLLETGLSWGRSPPLPLPFTDGSAESSSPVDFLFAFGLERLETGSSVTMRALGAGKGEMLMFSKKLTRLRQERVGLIVVGLVMVDVSI